MNNVNMLNNNNNFFVASLNVAYKHTKKKKSIELQWGSQWGLLSKNKSIYLTKLMMRNTNLQEK